MACQHRHWLSPEAWDLVSGAQAGHPGDNNVYLALDTGVHQTNLVWIDPKPLQFGQNYSFDMSTKFGSNGFVRGTITGPDGVQTVNYNGQIGSDDEQFYWKEGIYSSDLGETLSDSFANLRIAPAS